MPHNIIYNTFLFSFFNPPQPISFICYEYCDDGCNASFITFYLLKKHIQTKHPSTSKERDNTKRAQRHTQMYSMEEEMAIDVAANEDLISDNEYIIEEDENSDENQVNELEEGYEMDNDYNESQDA